MSIFSLLGDAVNVPKIVQTGVPQISSFSPENFNLPTNSQKVAELGNKLTSSGQVGDFSNSLVNPSLLTPVDRVAQAAMFAAERARSAQPSVSASMFPGSNVGTSTMDLKVKISQSPTMVGSPNEVIFTVMPKIDESGSAEYEQISPVHHPGAIQKYKTSSARSWRVSGRLMSRTMEEATANLDIVNMIRAWRMPFYGQGTSQVRPDLLGAPPPILTLSAYGPGMIGPVKCVLKDFNWSWDNSLDWIPTINGNPFPVLLDINLSLEESWSPAEFSGFDIVKYRRGQLGPEGAFQRVVSTTSAPAQATVASTVSAGVTAGVSSQTTTSSANVVSASTPTTGPTVEATVVASPKYVLPEGYTRDPSTGLVRNTQGSVDRAESIKADGGRNTF